MSLGKASLAVSTLLSVFMLSYANHILILALYLTHRHLH